MLLFKLCECFSIAGLESTKHLLDVLWNVDVEDSLTLLDVPSVKEKVWRDGQDLSECVLVESLTA